MHCKSVIEYVLYSGMEKYSSGWRGAPAKGVGRVTGARVQIPLSPFSQYWLSETIGFRQFFMAKIWPYMLYIWGKKTTKYSICKKNVEKNKKDEKNILTYRYK